MMVFSLCFLGFCILVLAGVIIASMLIVVNPYLKNKNKIRESGVINDKYNMFATIDMVEIKKRVDDYIQGYINRYITYKFISKKVTYITQDAVETMINNVTKSIVIDIPDIYVFYLGLFKSFSNDDELIEAVHDRVVTLSVESVLNFNNSMT